MLNVDEDTEKLDDAHRAGGGWMLYGTAILKNSLAVSHKTKPTSTV